MKELVAKIHAAIGKGQRFSMNTLHRGEKDYFPAYEFVDAALEEKLAVAEKENLNNGPYSEKRKIIVLTGPSQGKEVYPEWGIPAPRTPAQLRLDTLATRIPEVLKAHSFHLVEKTHGEEGIKVLCYFEAGELRKVMEEVDHFAKWNCTIRRWIIARSGPEIDQEVYPRQDSIVEKLKDFLNGSSWVVIDEEGKTSLCNENNILVEAVGDCLLDPLHRIEVNDYRHSYNWREIFPCMLALQPSQPSPTLNLPKKEITMQVKITNSFIFIPVGLPIITATLDETEQVGVNGSFIMDNTKPLPKKKVLILQGKDANKGVYSPTPEMLRYAASIRGSLAEAIKTFNYIFDTGLTLSTEFLEAYGNIDGVQFALQAAVSQYKPSGQKIQAIKALRCECSWLGLKEAKDLVDAEWLK